MLEKSLISGCEIYMKERGGRERERERDRRGMNFDGANFCKTAL